MNHTITILDALGSPLTFPAQSYLCCFKDTTGKTIISINGIGPIYSVESPEAIAKKYNKYMDDYVRYMVSLKRNDDDGNLVNKWKSDN